MMALHRSSTKGEIVAGILLGFIMINSFNLRLRSYATTLGGQHSSDFPFDLDKWDHESSQQPDIRIWTTADLESAYSVLNLGQMLPFFELLADGKPVTVLAIGDSIVKVHGGCFHQDRLVRSWGRNEYGSHRTHYK